MFHLSSCTGGGPFCHLWCHLLYWKRHQLKVSFNGPKIIELAEEKTYVTFAMSPKLMFFLDNDDILTKDISRLPTLINI